MSKVCPAPKNRMITPQMRPTSPTRLVMKALRAASEFGFSSHQCPMSANEQRPDQLPAGEQLQRALAHDQPEHRGGEQRQEREVVGVAPVAADVVGAVDVHEQRDQRDDEQHHHGRAVEEHPGGELDVAARPPRPTTRAPARRRTRRAPPRPTGRRRGSPTRRRRGRARPRRPPAPPPPRAAASALCSASLTWSRHWTLVARAMAKQTPRAAMPISAPFFGMRFPKNRIRKNEAAGISGMT